jgi:allophanate hydrolase
VSTHEQAVGSATPPVWISRRAATEVIAAQRTASGSLAGLTVGIKDNIDVAGLATTAACPEYAYSPAASAPAVQQLEAAGAVVIGKTNMDQFATGLVGTRSPYGALSSVADATVVSGGSSSGSAVAVASGQCDIALGTDTAGSGRVPAALNGIVGLKPTRGRVSMAGVVPACRTLDCISVFARTVRAARIALAAMVDPDDPRPDEASGFARLAAPRVGVPMVDQLEFCGDAESPELFRAAVERLRRLGAEIVEIDFAPFNQAGGLLYGGPWVAERYAAVGQFLRSHRGGTFDPIVKEIILTSNDLSAVDAFRGIYELADLVAAARAAWARIDVLALPTVVLAPTHDAVADDPHGVNTKLGLYTRFVNLMDLCAISVPAGAWSGGVPFGLQLVAPAMQDAFICDLAERFEVSARDEWRVKLAVVGAHLSGQPLNHELTSRGAQLVAATRTAREYRLFRLPGGGLPKPGLVHAPDAPGVAAIEVEVWELDAAAFGAFVAEVPAPLAIGNVTLSDGERVKGFVCEPRALNSAHEITATGGWRAYLARGHTTGR